MIRWWIVDVGLGEMVVPWSLWWRYSGGVDVDVLG